jgi:hypothetical protein
VDVLLKLRVLIWVLVLSLWGVMVYQYLGGDEAPRTAMHRVVNPYRGPDTGAPTPIPPDRTPLPETVGMNVPAAGAPLAAPGGPAVAAAVPRGLLPQGPEGNILPPPGAVGPAPDDDQGQDRGGAAAAAPPSAPAGARAPARRSRVRPPPEGEWREIRGAVPAPPVPPGFVQTVTPHFNIYAEGSPASKRFVEMIETIHGNLMLDLAPFSPWADEQRVAIFLFRNQETYRRVTGRPPWSGGAASVAHRRVYVYESDELPGILSHELTHVYYDGFYLSGHSDPLWLSEGMATVSQVSRGLAAPTWLTRNLGVLEKGGGYPFSQLMAVTTTAGMTDAQVRLWYAESYSLVRYLLSTQYRSSFYRFSVYIRDGRPVEEALYRAYGAPYTRIRALEIAWRASISGPARERFSVEN